MTIKCTQADTTFDIPQHHLCVSAGAHDKPTLQPNGINGTFMSRKSAIEFERFTIPNADFGVLRTDGKEIGSRFEHEDGDSTHQLTIH